MATENMYLKINYDINSGDYKLDSNVSESLQNEIIKNYLKDHQGTGMGLGQFLSDGKYKLELYWSLKSGKQTLKSNFDNLGVRDYILHQVSSNLEKIVEKNGCLLG